MMGPNDSVLNCANAALLSAISVINSRKAFRMMQILSKNRTNKRGDAAVDGTRPANFYFESAREGYFRNANAITGDVVSLFSST